MTMNHAETSAAAASRARIQKLAPKEVASALPFTAGQSTAIVEGHRTHVITQHYADCILVIITQVGKIGALVCKDSLFDKYKEHVLMR